MNIGKHAIPRYLAKFDRSLPVLTKYLVEKLRKKMTTLTRFLLLAILCFPSLVLSQNLILPVTEGSEASVELKQLDTPEAVNAMIARLSDNEVRALLIDQLATGTANEQITKDVSVIDFLINSFKGIGVQIGDAVDRLPILGTKQSEAFRSFFAAPDPVGFLPFIGFFLLAISIGYAAERLIRLLARSWREQIDNRARSDGLWNALRLLAMRFTLDVSGLVVFYLVANNVLEAAMASTKLAGAQLTLVYLIMLPRIALAISRFLLAPHRSDLRVMHIDDISATYLHRHQAILIGLVGFQIGIIAFNQLNGIPTGEMRLGFWTNGLIHLYFIYIFWQLRQSITGMLIGSDNDVTPTEQTVARFYPGFLIGLSILMWIVAAIIVFHERFDLVSGGNHLWTVVIFSYAPVFDTAIRGLVRHLVKPMQGQGSVAERAYQSTKRSYIRIGRLLIFAVVVMLIANLWDIDFHNVASAGLGLQAAARFIEFLMILAGGYLLGEIITLWINRKLADEQTASGANLEEEEIGGEGGGAGSSRLSTILPLVRATAQVIIFIMTILMGLSNIGVNITPLLAGAGIAGIAIGFGAQKLVTDIVSGIFFLIDDAFRSGEYVDVEGTVGTVEKISLRSMQLRHHRGHVHTIPYGQIPKITNFSRDWVIMKLRFTVPFDTDLNKVKKIFKQIGADMMEVPEFAEDFIQPFKSQGVLEVDDVGIVMRGKFMAKPGKQFVLRKEIYQRVQKAFEANDLQFARKEVRVKLDEVPGRELTEQDKQAIAAAAAESAANPPLSESGPKPDPI